MIRGTATAEDNVPKIQDVTTQRNTNSKTLKFAKPGPAGAKKSRYQV